MSIPTLGTILQHLEGLDQSTDSSEARTIIEFLTDVADADGETDCDHMVTMLEEFVYQAQGIKRSLKKIKADNPARCG